MKDLEANKIFAAILVAGIIAMLAGFVADTITHPHPMEKNAIEIEGSDGVAQSGPPKADLPAPILALIAEADIERGQKLSKACAACHTFTKGGKNGVGPNLWDVVGAPKEAKDGYSYSGVLASNGVEEWDYMALNKFLYKPKKYAPGTKMNFVGLKKPQDRANVTAWLRTLSDNSLALPSQTAIDAEITELTPPALEEATEVLLEDTPAPSAH